MPKTMQITMIIKDENGREIISKSSERTVPYIEEVEKQGFRSAFHELETAVLESRKEVCDNAVSDYLATMSQKKREANLVSEKKLIQVDTESQVN
jgi:hypothetical protein